TFRALWASFGLILTPGSGARMVWGPPRGGIARSWGLGPGGNRRNARREGRTAGVNGPMAMTRSATDGVATEETDAADARAGPEGPAPARRRRVERLRELPSSRAIVGGLLVAVAGAGTLLAWQEASGRPARSYVVAARAIVPGETLTADDVRLAAVDLPGGVAAAAFPDADGVVDRVALGPIGEGELIQAGQLSDPGAGPPTVEVALALERDRAVDGRLRSGDLVDVFATYDDRTEAVAE